MCFLSDFRMRSVLRLFAHLSYCFNTTKRQFLTSMTWVAVGCFSKVVATFNQVGGSFNLFMAIIGDVWIIPPFRIWSYHGWPSTQPNRIAHNLAAHHRAAHNPADNPFSFLNSSLGFAGGKYYQKIIIPVFRLVLLNFAIPGNFPHILFYSYIFSCFLQVGLLLQSGSASVRELVDSQSCCKLI